MDIDGNRLSNTAISYDATGISVGSSGSRVGQSGHAAELDRILAEGAERARDVASTTLAKVYDRVGFLPSKR